jgi:hypothetical protein
VANQFGGLNKRAKYAMQRRDQLMNIINVTWREPLFRKGCPTRKMDDLEHEFEGWVFLFISVCLIDASISETLKADNGAGRGLRDFSVKKM